MIPLLIGLVVIQSQTLSVMADQVAKHPTAAGYRALAAAYEEAGRFSQASTAFEAASERYAKLGDLNAAKVLAEQALRYSTDLRLFVEQPNTNEQRQGAARLEPAYGCYVGANVEREDGTRDPGEFDEQIGKPQAFFFIYRSYGNSFPTEYARKMKRIGAGLQIAWEPSNLDLVQDDQYLERFATEAADSGIPVFIRFASEMNGDWTPYHSDPVLYREKFRLVADVFHRIASNAAMVWCPNEIPEMTIPDYFPGDDAVDWVGVNFYSVLYNDGRSDRVASWRNPTDALRYVYARYSANHPIMVGEWAATHMSVVDHVDRTDFAVDKIGQLYAGIPRMYPRVKAVNWLSMNTEKYAEGDRKLNDFCLLDDGDVASAYSKAIAPDYYLSRATLDPDKVDVPKNVLVPVSKQCVVKGDAVISALVRSYDQHPHVIYTVGSVENYDGGTATGPYEIHLDTRDYPNGPLGIQIKVIDSRGRIAGVSSATLTVNN
jgi:hypothetical protein